MNIINSTSINRLVRVIKKLSFFALIGLTTLVNANGPNIGIMPNAIDKEIEAKFVAFNKQCMSTAALANLEGSGFVYGIRDEGDAELRMQCVPHPMMRLPNKSLKIIFNLTTATEVKGCREDNLLCSVKTTSEQGKTVTHYLYHTGGDDLYIAGIVVAPNLDMSENTTALYTIVSKKCYQRSDKQKANDVLGLIGGTLVCLTDRGANRTGGCNGSKEIVKDTSANLLGDIKNQCLNE